MEREGIPFLVEQDNELIICIFTPEVAKKLVIVIEKMRNKFGQLSEVELKIPGSEGETRELHASDITIDSESLASLGILPKIYLDTYSQEESKSLL